LFEIGRLRVLCAAEGEQVGNDGGGGIGIELVEVVFDGIGQPLVVGERDGGVSGGFGELGFAVEEAPEPVEDVFALGVEDVSAGAVEEVALYAVASDESAGFVGGFEDGDVVVVA